MCGLCVGCVWIVCVLVVFVWCSVWCVFVRFVFGGVYYMVCVVCVVCVV